MILGLSACRMRVVCVPFANSGLGDVVHRAVSRHGLGCTFDYTMEVNSAANSWRSSAIFQFTLPHHNRAGQTVTSVR